MKMDSNMNMSSMDMSMPTEATVIGDKFSTFTPPETQTYGTKYQSLKAAVKTNDPDKPISKVIKMELFGYMDRYIWFINGVPEYRAHPIPLEPNKRYRFIFTNPSMMRHPMHIHGHWFILRMDMVVMIHYCIRWMFRQERRLPRILIRMPAVNGFFTVIFFII